MIKKAYTTLSSGQRKVAEFILHNLNKAAVSTAEQIGREINVSQTTVIRLAYALGFSGFSEMQSLIQKQVFSEQENRVPQTPTKEDMTTFANIVEKEIAILQEFKNQLNEDQIWQAVNWLIEADQVLVIGHRTSMALALWLSILLNEIRDHVYTSSFAADTLTKILNLSEKSVVILISYPRYTKDAIKIAQCAKEQASRIIAITDQVLSPADRIADLTFIAKTHAESGANSFVSPHSLLNLILFGMNQKLRGEIQNRRIKLEQFYSTFNIFDE